MINIFKRWKDPYDKIRTLPRYSDAEVIFKGKMMRIVDNVTFLHSIEEIFCDEVYKFKTSNLQPRILDCGSNIGLSILYFKELFPTSLVIGFEPDPQIFKVLQDNMKAFELSGVELVEAAVWDKDGDLSFQQEGGHSGSVSNFWDSSKEIVVKSVDLKRYLTNKVDLLKLDIEGAETIVLDSIKNNLDLVQNIVIEYHSKETNPQSLGEILTILKDNGFRYHIRETFVRKNPFVDRDLMLGMDLQLNVYGYKK